MARREDTPKDDSYSSTVRKTLITNEGKEVTSSNPLPTETKITDGNVSLDMADLKQIEIRELLEMILIEMRKLTIHMQMINDEKVSEEDTK